MDLEQNIWFWLWVLLSTALIYFSVWTLWILIRQKKAWKEFADRHKLRYRPQGMFASPEVAGVLGGYTISLFTSEHGHPDDRTSRKLTAIELHLKSNVDFNAVLANEGMVEVAGEFGFREEVRPKIKGWSKNFLARGDNKDALKSYLTADRLNAILSLMNLKNALVVLAFKDDISLLRLDTPYPLDDKIKVEKLMKRMVDVANILET